MTYIGGKVSGERLKVGKVVPELDIRVVHKDG